MVKQHGLESARLTARLKEIQQSLMIGLREKLGERHGKHYHLGKVFGKQRRHFK